ncbi:MAG: hypothetical protein ACXADL_09025 [Candidatus Thorarchaeota archaeon]|jgi:hypothetical protein
MTNPTNEESWDALSEYYQAEICISLDDVHYGPYGPGEKELGVIGGVQDLDVLELTEHYSSKEMGCPNRCGF